MRVKAFFKGFLEWLLDCSADDKEKFANRLIEAGYLATFQLIVVFAAMLMCKIIFSL